MELEIIRTDSFCHDMKRVPAVQMEQIERQIQLVSGSLLNGRAAFKENSSIPYIFNLKYGLNSSLYLLKANENKRLVVAVDEDTVFDKLSLTLFRIVDKRIADKVYKEEGEKIYKEEGLL